MTIKKNIPILFLFLIIVSLSALFFIYNNYQKNLYLETNNLYQKNTGVITSNIKAIDFKDENMWVFKTIDHSTRLIKTKGGQTNLPIYQGRQIEEKEQKVALVGSNVPRERKGDDFFFALGKDSFKIVGFLGTQKKSLLQNEVIIKDDSLFDNKNEELILSSDSYISTSLKINKKIQTNILGRRTNIDYISPLILSFMIIVITGVSAATGAIIEKNNYAYNHFIFLKGISIKKIIVSNLIKYDAILLFITSIFFVLLQNIDTNYLTNKMLIIILLYNIFFMNAGFILSSKTRRESI